MAVDGPQDKAQISLSHLPASFPETPTCPFKCTFCAPLLRVPGSILTSREGAWPLCRHISFPLRLVNSHSSYVPPPPRSLSSSTTWGRCCCPLPCGPTMGRMRIYQPGLQETSNSSSSRSDRHWSQSRGRVRKDLLGKQCFLGVLRGDEGLYQGGNRERLFWLQGMAGAKMQRESGTFGPWKAAQ